MAEGLLGKKVGMAQIYNEKGEVIPVTVLEVGPCFVTQIKSLENDGYGAIQLGFGESKRLNKPQRGHLKNLPSLGKLVGSSHRQHRQLSSWAEVERCALQRR